MDVGDAGEYDFLDEETLVGMASAGTSHVGPDTYDVLVNPVDDDGLGPHVHVHRKGTDFGDDFLVRLDSPGYLGGSGRMDGAIRDSFAGFMSREGRRGVTPWKFSVVAWEILYPDRLVDVGGCPDYSRLPVKNGR